VNGNFDVVDQTLLEYNILDAGLTAKLGRVLLQKLLMHVVRPSPVIICQAIVRVGRAWVEGVNDRAP
jgi:hypothetical protein